MRRPQGATKLDVDSVNLSEDGRSEWTDAKNILGSIPRKYSGSAQVAASQMDPLQQTGRSSETPFHPTFRNTASSDALFMSPTSRMIYDRSLHDGSGQAEGLCDFLRKLRKHIGFRFG
jgi:hypothetical protein